MFILVSVLIFIVAVLLIMVILVQNPKGGLASNFSSSNQVMGVRKTTDFLEKATWTLGIALLIFSVVSSSLIGGTAEVATAESELTDEANAAPVISPNDAQFLQQEGVPEGTAPTEQPAEPVNEEE